MTKLPEALREALTEPIPDVAGPPLTPAPWEMALRARAMAAALRWAIAQFSTKETRTSRQLEEIFTLVHAADALAAEATQ